MIDCREAVTRMWAYLEQGLESDRSRELDAHLDVCLRCCGELEFSRQLRDRVSTVEPIPLPETVRGRIERLLEPTD